MPLTFASFSRAPGFSVYLPESKSTSDILTISPARRFARHQNYIQLLPNLIS